MRTLSKENQKTQEKEIEIAILQLESAQNTSANEISTFVQQNTEQISAVFEAPEKDNPIFENVTEGELYNKEQESVNDILLAKSIREKREFFRKMELEDLKANQEYMLSVDNDECFDLDHKTYSPLALNLGLSEPMILSNENWMNVHVECEVYRDLDEEMWKKKKGLIISLPIY